MIGINFSPPERLAKTGDKRYMRMQPSTQNSHKFQKPRISAMIRLVPVLYLHLLSNSYGYLAVEIKRNQA